MVYGTSRGGFGTGNEFFQFAFDIGAGADHLGGEDTVRVDGEVVGDGVDAEEIAEVVVGVAVLHPGHFILVDEMLRLVTRVLDGLEVSPENMERNLELSQGSLLAERIVNLLVETGVPRQDAHERIRKLSIRSLDNKVPFGRLLLEDTFVSKRLKPKEIKEALDYRTYLGVTRELINLALKE